MASWLLPALKAVLPHVGDLVSAAKPVFTGRKAEPTSSEASLAQQQIAELQAATAQNATHIKELASKLQSTVSALEIAAQLTETRLRRALIVCALAAGVSCAALGVALFTLLAR
ncbi:MAG: hypothetical protein ACT4P4_03030 [Betaproteobacteria bacterium]